MASVLTRTRGSVQHATTLTALLGSRVLIWVAGVAAVEAFTNAIPGGIDPPGVLSGFGRLGDLLVAPAGRWDAAWYLLIAEHGYQPHAAGAPLRAVFFPFYPLLVAGLGQLGVPLLAAGVLVSIGALGVALAGLARLTAMELGGDAARYAVWALALCPTAVFFSAAYSDSLFLALSIGVFACARAGRWTWTALLVATATATRNTGLLLIAPVALFYLYGPRADRAPDAPTAPRLRPRYRLRGDAAWLALAPLGVGAYLAYWAIAGGDALAPLHGQVFFRHHFDGGPFVGLWDGVRAAVHDLTHPRLELFDTGPTDSVLTGWSNLFPLAVLLASLPAIVGVLRRLPVAYGAYVVLGLAVPLSYPVAGAPLQSLPRYETVLFPLFMWLGWWLVKRPRLALALLSASGLAAALLAGEFATWHFVA